MQKTFSIPGHTATTGWDNGWRRFTAGCSCEWMFDTLDPAKVDAAARKHLATESGITPKWRRESTAYSDRKVYRADHQNMQALIVPIDDDESYSSWLCEVYELAVPGVHGTRRLGDSKPCRSLADAKNLATIIFANAGSDVRV